MPFSDCAQAQDEAQTAGGGASLVDMGDDAWIEQSCRFERIFEHEIGADQSALFLRERGVFREGVFHVVGARFEQLEQIAMSALEIVENISKLACRRFRPQREYAIDDVIRPSFVSGIEVAWFGRRPERAYDHPRRIRAKVQTLPIQ